MYSITSGCFETDILLYIAIGVLVEHKYLGSEIIFSEGQEALIFSVRRIYGSENEVVA
ncbi:MAG: hypothetical protein ABJH07_08465 [Sedimentitalea sp.]|uniref:hypothetical protein n=1 Tax=Sedimentitalea sp. TaxID=2048915 RepID=UPI00329A29EF